MATETSTVHEDYDMDKLYEDAPEDLKVLVKGLIVNVKNGRTFDEAIKKHYAQIEANKADPGYEDAKDDTERVIEFLQQKGIK